MRLSTAFTLLGCALLSSVVGCGAPDPAPESPPKEDPQESPLGISAEKTGNPSWEIADAHQLGIFRGDDPESSEVYRQFIKDTLAPPNHKWIDGLGIGPGEAHEGPYDHEIADGLSKLDGKEGSTFTAKEITFPNTFLSLFMAVPSEGSPTGSSPDAANGPIIPHTIFPIGVEFAYSYNDVKDADVSGGFFVPTLDKIDSSLMVDGHSHFPIFFAASPDEPNVLGVHHWELRMIDAANNGWTVHMRYKVTE